MRLSFVICMLAVGGARAASPDLTEAEFRQSLNISGQVRLSYRGLDCKPATFEAFARDMYQPHVRSDVERAVDGTQITVTARRRGGAVCPSAYPPVTTMPPFSLRDLAGKPMSAADLKGKVTLVNFFYAQCVPCILEIGPLNRFAASRPEMNFLAVTFDEPEVARAFVARFEFRWRVLPDAQDFIDRMRIKQYPAMALFDANGRLLGTRRGGVRDEFEAATVAPQLARWVDGLLRANGD